MAQEGCHAMLLMQRNCAGVAMDAQQLANNALPEPMTQAFLPSDPREDCAADSLGPLPSEESLLVVVDYFSRCFEVVILRSSLAPRSLKRSQANICLA